MFCDSLLHIYKQRPYFMHKDVHHIIIIRKKSWKQLKYLKVGEWFKYIMIYILSGILCLKFYVHMAYENM